MGFLSINSLLKAASAIKKGHRQGTVQGNALQLGGAVIIDTAGTVCYYFAAAKAGEHPDIDRLLNGVEKAASSF